MSILPSPKRALAIPMIATLAAVTGCATTATGMGGGDLGGRGDAKQPVLFAWQSGDGGVSGSLTATLPGRTFVGPFSEITLRTPRENLAPFWAGWNEGWGDWPYSADGWDSAGASAQFTHWYSGKVVANLRDARGESMRCRFDLADALKGLRGGAHGQCQLVGGEILDATIDKH
jgi:hypothetical protein